jgi:nitrile hydratase subunit beta
VNGAQDLGGQMGFGRVSAEPAEPTFHEEWEGRVLGLALTVGALGEWNIDESRSARETLHPVTYLSASYYEIWLRGLIKLLDRRGLVTADELRAGRVIEPRRATKRDPLPAANVKPMLRGGGAADRPSIKPQQFHLGDKVRTHNNHPTTHTRLPRYVRGRVGTVEAVHGTHVFPDSAATGGGEDPQWLYTVAFDGRELWGERSDPRLIVSVDAFEPYLERIGA